MAIILYIITKEKVYHLAKINLYRCTNFQTT